MLFNRKQLKTVFVIRESDLQVKEFKIKKNISNKLN